MISIISDNNGFKQLKETWDTIYYQDNNAKIFQSFDYNYISWNTICSKTKGHRLYILVHHKSEGSIECDAIFPFYIDKSSSLRFINDIHTDICNCIISDEVKNIYDLIYDLYLFIDKDPNIKRVFLDNLPSTSPLSTYLKVFKRNAFFFSQTEHSYINIPKSDDPIQTMTHLKAKNRKNLKDKYKECKDLYFKIYNNISGDKYPKNKIVDLMNDMILHKIRSKNYFTYEMLKLWEELYLSSLVEIAILYKDSNPVSIGIIFYDSSKYVAIRWIVLYKDVKYNMLNYIMHIISKAKQNNITIDFGRGAYDYKISNFKPKIENLYRLMYSKTLLGNIYILCKINLSHIRKTISVIKK